MIDACHICRTHLSLKCKEIYVSPASHRLTEVLIARQDEIIGKWVERQAAAAGRRTPAETQDAAQKSRELMKLLAGAMQKDGSADINGPAWQPLRDLLADFSENRSRAGFSPSETASFVFSLKQPLFAALRQELGKDADVLAETLWLATELVDQLGLLTMEVFQKTREDIIGRQQQELLELSTPVVRLWDNILALPLIGTLDSARTQIVMQNLLEAIVQTRSDYAIIDITGVPLVDTLVAQHLLKTVAAARLMGADCLISGIRPQIAQTIIHLGVDLTDVTTKATLADAFAVALRRSGQVLVKDTKHQAGR
jgi:rsbT co-antagonist protein RsbR